MLRLDWNLLWTALNILIWYALIKKFLMKPINDVLEKRNAEVAEKYEEAEKAKEDALELKARYEKELAGVDDAKSQKMSEADADARREYERVLAEANAEAEKLIAAAKEESEAIRVQTLSDEKEELTDLVAEAVGKALIAGSGEKSDRKLYEKFLEEGIGGGKEGNG